VVLGLGVSATLIAAAPPVRTRVLDWKDLPAATQHRLAATGLTATSFAAYLQQHNERTAARVREGDLDALIYFALQSTSFTTAPPIEPALSAKGFVETMAGDDRARFLAGDSVAGTTIPSAARARLAALAAALRHPAPNFRLACFHDILERERPADQLAFLAGEYIRAMRFLYQKEFVALRSQDPSAVAALYQARGLSTDTAVEAGFLVQLALKTIRATEPERRIGRVLIVGPGFDLAPRTGLIEAGAPESYQPYAVADSLVALGLAKIANLTIIGADVNPRVVAQLESAASRQVELTLVSGVGDSAAVKLEDDYRAFFEALGNAIGQPAAAPALPARYAGHLRKTLTVAHDVPAVLRGVTLDIAAARLDEPAFDLVIATNVLPYLDDTQLAMAVANVASMLAPNGIFLHNESRPLILDLAKEDGLPLRHARTAAIATVRGAPPLADAVWIHEKPQ
jgi:hypothetical protein